MVTADRGLAGGYNVNVIRRLQGILDEETREVDVVAIGRKGRDFLRKRGTRAAPRSMCSWATRSPSASRRRSPRELMDDFHQRPV